MLVDRGQKPNVVEEDDLPVVKEKPAGKEKPQAKEKPAGKEKDVVPPKAN